MPDTAGVFASSQDKCVAFRPEPHAVNRTPQSELWLAEFSDPDGNQFALLADFTPAG